jgi:alkanesulfonate monooxygenase SsuD/methylene tetrahydromethanopterin reductase-like flavin-dependent oxidoreductase (luciferase family)
MASGAAGSSRLKVGVFDDMERLPDVPLDHLYAERLEQVEYPDRAGFLAEHQTPAVHSLAASQSACLAAVAQQTRHLGLAPCVYFVRLPHPLRLIQEV